MVNEVTSFLTCFYPKRGSNQLKVSKMYTCGNSMWSCIVANRARKHDDKHFREGKEKRPSTVGDME